MARSRFVAIAIIAIAMSGCANLDTVHHEFEAEAPDGKAEAKVVSIDAYQRFLEMAYSTDAKEGFRIWKFCTEPKPDALAAFGSNASASGGTAQASGNLAFSSSEAAAAFGLRTQSIAILGDLGFRLCEGYLNRALTPTQFQALHHRLQSVVVATLAIEQLTGYARPSLVTIGAPPAPQPGTDPNQNKKEPNSSPKTPPQKITDTLPSIGPSAPAPSQVPTPPPSPPSSPQATAEIAKAIAEIVTAVINRDYTREVCLEYVTTSIPFIEMEEKDNLPKALELRRDIIKDCLKILAVPDAQSAVAMPLGQAPRGAQSAKK